MPNWCIGSVTVSGKSKDVENFCKLFLFEEDVNKEETGKKCYFARSFIHDSWKNFKKDFLGGNYAEFDVDFAWSCWSCIFEGYPNGEECVTLEWAIKEYNVNVEITTEEIGECFEEKVTTQNGKPIYEIFDMPTHQCICGNKQSIPSACDIDEEECCVCEKVGRWGDEFTELVKEKIEMIEENKK